jgi:hypothetical protein
MIDTIAGAGRRQAGERRYDRQHHAEAEQQAQ